MPERQHGWIDFLLERRLTLLAAVALLVLGGVGYLSLSTTAQLVDNNRSVAHTYEVLRELDRVLSLTTDAETASRGYMVRGTEQHLAPFEAARAQIEPALARLRGLTADNPDQQARLRELEQAVEEKLDFSVQLIETRREEGLREAVRLFLTDRGEHAMDRVRGRVSVMKDAEARLLEQRNAHLEAAATRARMIEVGGATLSLAVLAIVFFLLNYEVRQRRRLTRELEERNRELDRRTAMKTRFLASMSHELRTPLSGIMGFSDLLAEESAGPLNEKQKRYNSHVRDGARHLLRVINDVLDLSRVESGRIDLHMEDFRLADVLAETFAAIRPQAMNGKLLLEEHCPDLYLHADRLRVKQILLNLLSNAVKFTPEGGRVRVEATVQESFACIAVSDTGHGIPPEHQEAIFEEFRQVSSAARGKEGAGLGLAICKSLVEQHGGFIRVESEPGLGSCFQFTIPLAAAAAQAEAAQTLDPPGGRKRPLVLVVDDQPAARELLTQHLTPENYDVITAATADEAVVKARELQPDAITLDLLMPGRNGVEALFELKSDPATIGIPIIVVSVVEDRTVGFALGASEYLVKPVEKSALLAAMERHLPARPGEKTSLLVVDDDAGSRQLACAVLSANGYLVLAAENGRHALEVLARQSVHAVLLDLLMPEMDGFELLQHLKQDPVLRELPIFVLTAKELTSEELELLNRQADALLRKEGPWKEELLARLRKAAARRSQPASSGA